MNLKFHQHREGMSTIPEEILSEIVTSLEEIHIDLTTERPSDIRNNILDVLNRLGWSNEVRLDPSSGITITSMLKGIALALQTGNMARFYADLLKLQTLYTMGRAKAAIYIIFSSDLANELGNNLAQFERLVEELRIFEVTITIPMIVIGIE